MKRTHLTCRDVFPPMPCFLEIKHRYTASLFRGLHLQSGMYSKYPYGVRTAYIFREWPSCEAITDLSILTPLPFQWISPMLLLLLLLLLLAVLLFFFFFFSGKLSSQSGCVWCFCLDSLLNASFAETRGAIPPGYTGATIGDGEESY